MFANELTPTQLVDALNTLSVPFIGGGSGTDHWIETSVLLAALADSNEARLRLSLIPLLLSYPQFSADVNLALARLSPAAAITLRCYYTAAYWLQYKCRTRIETCLGSTHMLPDLFSGELGLSAYDTTDQALRALAIRQQELTGYVLNWYGTYEHGVTTWLKQTIQQGNIPSMVRTIGRNHGS